MPICTDEYCSTVIDPDFDACYDNCGQGCCGYRCEDCTEPNRNTEFASGEMSTPRFGEMCVCGDLWDDHNGMTCPNGGTFVHATRPVRAVHNPNATDIHNYGYKPRPYMPKGNYPQEVLMGLELEVGGAKYEIAGRVKQIDPQEEHIYCKDDCSIHGVEIVTHPMTLAYAHEYPFAELLAKLRDIDCYADKSDCICGDGSYCEHEYGLHIHVSRNAFRQLRKRKAKPESPSWDETYEQRIGRELREMQRQARDQNAINHQMIWLMFLERNADKLAGEMMLCRRDPSRYGAFKESSIETLRAKASDNPCFDDARYSAINCQNDKTYELRFFKSTVGTEELYAALEFADASVEYTRGISANDVLRNRALQWSQFVEWTRARGGRYSNLLAQIDSLGIAA